MPIPQKYQSLFLNKRFSRKTVIGFIVSAGLAGLLISLVYRPLLQWSPASPQVIVETTDTVYFDINSTTPKPETYQVLENIIKQNKSQMIVIIGGADSTGNLIENWRLSQARATAIREMLVRMGIKSDSIISLGFGDRRPLVPNTTTQGRQINRNTLIKWKKLK